MKRLSLSFRTSLTSSHQSSRRGLEIQRTSMRIASSVCIRTRSISCRYVHAVSPPLALLTAASSPQQAKLIGFLRFSFELSFEVLLEPEKENAVASDPRVMIGLKFEKDMCDCEFKAIHANDYQLWRTLLAKRLTQKNFYAYYEVKRVIG